MLKRLSIILMTILVAVPAMAQPTESCECVFGPKKGQVQFQLSIGQGQFFNDGNGLYYMLPDEDGTATGLGLDIDAVEPTLYGNEYVSGDISQLLVNPGSLNFTIPNFSVGVKAFITDRFNLNLSGAYLGNIQPSKDFIEGDVFGIDKGDVRPDDDPSYSPAVVGPSDIYAHKAVLGQVSHRWYVQLGAEWYFKTPVERLFPYAGVFGRFQMARIEGYYPVTGQTVRTDVDTDGQVKYDELDLYRTGRAGQALGIGGGLNFGVEYDLLKGLFIAAEVAPVYYQYSLLHMQVNGQDPYYVANHDIRAFAHPQLIIGVRF